LAHLVFQTAFPGDLFLSIPLIKNIKSWDPEIPIVLACRPGLGQFFVESGLVSEVVEIDKRSAEGRASSLTRLRRETWDVIFVPHESPRTALWMSRLRARRAKIGFRRWWNGFFFSARVRKPMALPEALRQLSLLEVLDPQLEQKLDSAGTLALRNSASQKAIVDFAEPSIPPWAQMTVASKSELIQRSRTIYLAPGSIWATKRWTAHGYREVARQLVQRGLKVVLVGSAGEKPLCDSIQTAVPEVTNLAGQTTLAELIERFRTGLALVCNDSGAMHEAAVAELPTVAIFGPTVLAQGFRPWQNRARVVQRELPCRPCGRHGGRRCPIGTHACMEQISPSEVLTALGHLVKL
jgi:heptosyltransferase-2